MTKGAKGRGDAAPPDGPDWASLLEGYRRFYEQTGNPLFVWKALFSVDCHMGQIREYMGETRESIEKSIEEGAGKLPPDMVVPVPAWCWEYLCKIAYEMQLASGISANRPWEITRRELIEISEPLAKEGEEEAKRLLETVQKLDKNLPATKATQLVKDLPRIFDFVDGADSNAFLDYWRWERKLDVWHAWYEAERKGMAPKEILAAVSEKTGIYDEPTIRRYVKEAMGKALPRRRSNKPKAPKEKKD
jgi:hypothetical protein